MGLDVIAEMRSWLNGTAVPSYADIVQRWGNDFLMYRDAWELPGLGYAAQLQNYAEMFRLREEQAIPEFGFSIPCAEVLGALQAYQPILEVGAGTGYWTALMRQRSIDVIGTDPDDQGWWERVGQYDSQQIKLGARQALQRWPERTVFCSWPSYKETWFLQTLRVMQVGRYLILIEEDSCADDKTWKYRDRNFELLTPIKVPAWPGMNDRCGVWRRERNHADRVHR